MRSLLAILRNLLSPNPSHNKDFLELLKVVESLVSKVLSLLMIVVILFSIYELVLFQKC